MARTTTKITKVGNSASVRLAQDVLSESDLHIGEAVTVSARRGEVVIRPADTIAAASAEFARECTARYRRTLEKLGE